MVFDNSVESTEGDRTLYKIIFTDMNGIEQLHSQTFKFRREAKNIGQELKRQGQAKKFFICKNNQSLPIKME